MVNKVILIGNLGSDPELRHTQGGTAVAKLSVATGRHWKDSNGQRQEETEWHTVVVWDKAAEFCSNYLSKGSKVYVEGRLQTRKWQDQGGNDRWTTEIIANVVQNLSPRQAGGNEAYGAPEGSGVGEDVPF